MVPYLLLTNIKNFKLLDMVDIGYLGLSTKS